MHPSSVHQSAILPVVSNLFSMPPFYTLFLGLLLLHVAPSCSSAAVNDDTLTAGHVLAVGGKLVSRNGKFALGFFQYQPASTISKLSHNATSPCLWYLGIWFNKIPVCTTVWVANRDQPIPDTNLNLTQLKISSDGNLVIVNHATNNESVVWSTHIANNRTQTSGINNTTGTAVLLNTGNLALTGSASSHLLVWQSFDYPTDVVLPGAKFGRNKVNGFNRQPISKKSLIDPGLGSYSIELEVTKGIVLKRRNPSVEYWVYPSSKISSLDLLSLIKPLLDLDPRTKGLINPAYVDTNQEEYYMYTSPDESFLSFISLDISGQLKLNVWSQANQSWQTIYAQPNDLCTPPASCGPFTVCSVKPHPYCDCMESFSQKSPHDWEFEDRTGGCIRNTPLQCSTSDKNITSSTDIFHPIDQVSLPYNPQSIVIATTLSNCQESCLRNCSCTAYSYNNNRCSVWNGELLSVNLNDGADKTSEDVLYLRLSTKDLLPSLRKKKRKTNIGVVTATSIIGFALLMVMLLLLIWRNRFKWCGFLYDNKGSAGGIISFRYTDLVRATKNFSEKLGGGAFGSVYKGVLSDSKTAIAVKRLDGAHQGEKQFRAEVSSIGLIQHINLVKLIGFCCQGDHRLLVYEHISRGSLDCHLFKKSNNSDASVLNWNSRYQITLGIARGLSYLHQSCRECIIHCDIKPENILVDASFVPKVADFGLAAFVGRDFSRILTTFRGTIGYLAPEWLTGVAITPKIDVYSFGMVLLEIIAGRRNSSPETSRSTCSSSYEHVEYFPVQAINKLHCGDVKCLVDPHLHGDFSLEEAERVCKVACWCIQDNELDRPTMGEVVRVLEGQQEIDMPPMPRLLAAIAEQSGAVTSV